MFSMARIKDLHVIQKLEEIIGKWFQIDLVITDEFGKLPGPETASFKYYSYFFKMLMSSNQGKQVLQDDIEKGIFLEKIVEKNFSSFDNNGNKKWDTGDLLLKRQPERVIVCSKQIKILSDWEIEEEIIIKE
jgi:hypothetical protein